jgi:hypothetical protein
MTHNLREVRETRHVPVLIVLVVLVVAAIVLVLVLRGSEEATEQFTGDVRVVDADLIGGWIIVEPSTGGPTAVTRNTQWLLKRPSVSQELVDGTLTLRASGSPLVSGVTGYTVKAPPGVRVKARTLSAGIEVRGINGGAEIETASGGVTLDGVGGDIKVNTDVGDVTGTNLTSSALTVASRAAAVDVAFADAPVQVEVQSEGGAVIVGVPAAGAYDVDATSESGGVDVSVASEPGAPNRVRVKCLTGAVEVHGT